MNEKIEYVICLSNKKLYKFKCGKSSPESFIENKNENLIRMTWISSIKMILVHEKYETDTTKLSKEIKQGLYIIDPEKFTMDGKPIELPGKEEITTWAVSPPVYMSKWQFLATGYKDGMIKLWLVNDLHKGIEFNKFTFHKG